MNSRIRTRGHNSEHRVRARGQNPQVQL
jgi:hypothetical protein